MYIIQGCQAAGPNLRQRTRRRLGLGKKTCYGQVKENITNTIIIDQLF